MMDLEEYIVANSDMTLDEARKFLHNIEIEAWKKLGNKNQSSLKTGE